MNTDKAKARLEDIRIGKDGDLDTVILVIDEILDTVEIQQRRTDKLESDMDTSAGLLLQISKNLNMSADIQNAVTDRLLIVEAAIKPCP